MTVENQRAIVRESVALRIDRKDRCEGFYVVQGRRAVGVAISFTGVDAGEPTVGPSRTEGDQE